MEISTEDLKDLSVTVVESFINNKVSMNETITKIACDRELNPDQTKRLVETSNTVAYLKLQKEASDKTFEFPVADYNQVILGMVSPDKQDTSGIEAEFVRGQTKEAAYIDEHAFSLSIEETRAIATKEAYKNKDMLEKLAYDKAEILINIGDTLFTFSKDEFAMEKLAEVCDEETFIKLAFLVNKNGPTPLRKHIFKEAELNQAKHLFNLFKQAQELIKETGKREELNKKAFFQAIGAGLGMAARGIAGGLAKAVPALAKGKNFGMATDLALTAATEVKPEKSVWANLQGSQKRF